MEKHIEKIRMTGKITDEEFTHLSNCSFCQNNLTEVVEQLGLIKAPRHLKSSVMERSCKPDVQLIAGTRKLSKRLELFYYSLKVGAAVLGVLTMLAITPDMAARARTDVRHISSMSAEKNEFSWDYYNKVSNLTRQLGRLSNTNMEVTDYDKKEK